jgi:Ni/Co efflux regulator RcnB
MNSKAVVCVVMALSMSTGGLAIAQGNSNRDHGDRGDRGRGEQMQRGGDNDRGGRAERNDNRRDFRGAHDARGFGRSHNEEMRRGRGAGPDHAYYRGDRLPIEYRHRQYVVDNWRGYNLSAPPRGYHWVQSGGDFILVAVATGVILQLLLGR